MVQIPDTALRYKFIAALEDLHNRLRIYPQFGEPLRTLNVDDSELWIGVVDPLVVQYVINEKRRIIFVAVPLKVLPIRTS